MELKIRIPDKRINDLLHGHGGSASLWLHSLDGDLPDKVATVRFNRENGGCGEKIVERSDVENGLAIMCAECPYQFGEFLDDNDDDITFDTAWQFIIFGKLVYG